MSDDEASGNDGEVDLFEPQPKRLKLTLNKPEKEKFCWTLKHKTAMAKIVHFKNGHLSYVKDGLKKAQRWQAILLALQKTPLFVDLDISSKSLMNKFAEEVEKVCDNCGVTKQSVNLSGFSNKPPEYESLDAFDGGRSGEAEMQIGPKGEAAEGSQGSADFHHRQCIMTE